MTQEDVSIEYFNWLYSLVCSENRYNRLSYRKLLALLHDIEFTYIIERDRNREQDGIDFRYRFGYENGYPDYIIKDYLEKLPCSVLEMMVSLAFRVEEQIMDDEEYGNRTGQWFWNMVVSLGLGHMHDSNFDEYHIMKTIEIFLNRNYSANGRGGLFTIDNCPYDLRDIEIWTQCMWHLDEIIEN